MPSLSSMRTHRRPSIPIRLVQLLSDFYTTVSTHTCRILFQEIVLSVEHILTTYTMLTHRRTSLPLRLGPLPCEFYNMTSMRTHHRASVPHRLGPLPGEFYYDVCEDSSYSIHTTKVRTTPKRVLFYGIHN